MLRIEDTDQARSTDESVQAVLDAMRWLGLDWDEGPGVGGAHGPYAQTERLDIYRAHAETLIDKSHAYRCYATKEEVDRARKEFEAAGGKGFRFKSPWRDETKRLDQPYAVRLRAPADGVTGWDDLVKGRIEVPNSQQQDQILVRSDGFPTYNFGAAVDDLAMGITLVARGDDHMVNTPVQILLYEMFGAKTPAFAHLPMILGHDGKKMSKRHGSVSVLDYRDAGFLPDAIVNYLARLGWSHGDQEVFSRDELIASFDWAHVGKSGATYDAKKLAFVQAEHLRGAPNDEVAKLALPFLSARGLEIDRGEREMKRLASAIEYVKPRVITLPEVADHVDYFFRAEPVIDDKDRRKFLSPEAAPALESLRDAVAAIEPFDVSTLQTSIEAWMERTGFTMKQFAQSARVSLTGRTRSPGLYEVMEVLGRDLTLARLDWGIGLATSAGS